MYAVDLLREDSNFLAKAAARVPTENEQYHCRNAHEIDEKPQGRF